MRYSPLILAITVLLIASASLSLDEMPKNDLGRVHARFEDVSVSADEIDASLSGEVTASGDVVLTMPTTRLTCTSCRYDHRTGEFEACGGVELQHETEGEAPILVQSETVGGNRLTGDMMATGSVTFRQGDERSLTSESFTYNFLTGIGKATDAYSSVDKIYFHGQEIESEPGLYRVNEARFSTCDRRDDPHYYLGAQELIIRPGKDIAARQVRVHLWGANLLTVPQYRASLRSRDRAPIRLPTLGTSREYGPYAGYDFDISRGSGTLGSLELQVSARHSVLGGLLYDRIADQPIYARLTYRQAYQNGVRDDLLLSRLPEVGVRWCSGDDAQRAAASRSHATLSADTINPLFALGYGGDLNTITDVSIGRFSEFPTDVVSNRADARVVAWLTPRQIDACTFYSPGLSGRVSRYGNGDTYSSIAMRMGVARRLGENSYVSFSYITTVADGDTPFSFDRVELKEELTGRLAVPVGEYALELGGRYDLRQSRMFDSEIAVARRYHCLEPRIAWRSRHKDLAISIGLVGF